MIEHCVSAFKHMQEEKKYRVYVTDALQCIAGNTAAIPQDSGRYMTLRWADVIDGNTNEPEEDDRTTEEIVDDIWKNIEGKEEAG